MVLHRSWVGVAAAIIASSLIAGCASGGNKSRSGDDYPGEFKEYDLYLHALQTQSGNAGGWELYRGARVDAWAFSDKQSSGASIPGPVIHAREGDTIRVNFHTVAGTMGHTIHWHGLHVPWNMDGVPYVTQLPIGDSPFGTGQVFTYEFALRQSGTYWYHCHVDTAHHVDMGMYGAIIVDPKDASQDPPVEPDQDFTLVLDEWDRSHSHQNQEAITNALSRSGDPAVTANDLYGFMRDYLLMNSAYRDTIAGNEHLQNKPGIRETRDWYPVTYPPYFAEYDTYLINGKAYPDTKMLFVKANTTMRLRFINAGEEVHAMHLHGHHMSVTHKDGYLLPAPYYADTILIGPGERYDAYVYLDNPGPWMLHDHISLNEVNDYISPGGMMTMVCYRDGWTFPTNAGYPNECAETAAHAQHGQPAASGDFVMAQYENLLTHAGIDPQTAARLTGVGGMEPISGPDALTPSKTSAAPKPGLTVPALSGLHAH